MAVKTAPPEAVPVWDFHGITEAIYRREHGGAPLCTGHPERQPGRQAPCTITAKVDGRPVTVALTCRDLLARETVSYRDSMMAGKR